MVQDMHKSAVTHVIKTILATSLRDLMSVEVVFMNFVPTAPSKSPTAADLI